MVWFLHDLARLELERRAIEHLQSDMSWLKGVDWMIAEGGKLAVDAEIEVHGNLYQAKMTYPAAFPDAPPMVKPKNPGERWSSHQYETGTLCLEWGPDNWHRDITGAQMLESTHRLLHRDNPRGTEKYGVLPSRHALSPGQEVRIYPIRFCLGVQLKEFLSSLPRGMAGIMEFAVLYHQDSTCIAFILSLSPDGRDPWRDPSFPDGFLKEKARKGIFLKTGLSSDEMRGIQMEDELVEAIGKAGLDPVALFSAAGIQPGTMGKELIPALLAGIGDTLRFFVPADAKESGPFLFRPFDVTADSQQARLPSDAEKLSGRKVGIVGLGSVGSKMALSLARTGIMDFVLSDGDVFFPGNICRNNLDWRDVGSHKVSAMARALSNIGPSIKVDAVNASITGQESTSYINSVLDRLASCNLLIDATANPAAFNTISAIAVARSISMVWMEVFPGGIGGMIARYRPKIDPDPKLMRRAYLQFTEDHPFPDSAPAGTYAGEDSEGNPIVATDADVSVIADHATRMAIDAMVSPECSTFPFSLYLTGLRKHWVFRAPFHTIQIPTHQLPLEEDAVPPSADVLEEGRKFILGILERVGSDKDPG
jgi:hypothetical protein